MTRYSKNVKLLSLLANLERKLDQQLPDQPKRAKAPRIHKLERRLGPDVLNQLVADYQAGKSSNQLMSDYQLGKGTVLKVLHEAQVIKARKRPRRT